MRVGVVIAWVLCAAAARSGAAEEACETCHPDVKTEFSESVHARDFRCTACHGGDAAAAGMEAHAPTLGYIGKPERAAVPALCGSCHADPTRMQPFRVPTDQYAQYLTSGHGRRLAQGDPRVAICTDCHGTHRIISPRQPTSPASRANILPTCARCHSDAALMADYNLPADQAEKLLGSVHGAALLVEEHPSAPTCTTCHGAHGAVAPHVGSISMVCGHCHDRTREYFRQGPHRKATDEGRMSECVSCHGYHAIAPPDRRLFDTVCQPCHAAESQAFATGQKLKTLLAQTEESIATAAGELQEAAYLAPTAVRYRPRLQQAWAHFMEALPVQHALDFDRVSDLSRAARSVSDEVRSGVHGVRQEVHVRYVLLALMWVAVVFVAGLTHLYRRERQRARAGVPSEDRRAPGTG